MAAGTSGGIARLRGSRSGGGVDVGGIGIDGGGDGGGGDGDCDAGESWIYTCVHERTKEKKQLM